MSDYFGGSPQNIKGSVVQMLRLNQYHAEGEGNQGGKVEQHDNHQGGCSKG